MTRNVNKASSKDLLKYGSNIHLHECDLTNEASLTDAFKDAYGVFAFTNYFSHPIHKVEDITEEAEGRLLARVAKACGVTHYIWSTLPEIKERSGGKWPKVYHFDYKHAVDNYVKELEFNIASYVLPSCFLQGFMGESTYKVYNPICNWIDEKDENGTVVFSLPLPSLDSALPVCDVRNDFGLVVKAVFDEGTKANGKYYPIVSEFLEVSHLY